MGQNLTATDRARAMLANGGDECSAFLESLCDTGLCLCCMAGNDGVVYSLRIIPSETPVYRIFIHNNGEVLPFSSILYSRAEAVELFLETLK